MRESSSLGKEGPSLQSKSEIVRVTRRILYPVGPLQGVEGGVELGLLLVVGLPAVTLTLDLDLRKVDGPPKERGACVY